jgi:ribosomal protein S18 acetylase RimI-like enzyme
MPYIKMLGPDEWTELRDIRLSALKDSPDAFLATYGEESERDESYWRSEFARCDWHVGFENGLAISLLGCTRDIRQRTSPPYLEYLWVSPGARRRGVAFDLVSYVVERLRAAGVRLAYLWVLDGNDAAVRLYRRVGFVSTNHSQPLASRPGRHEEKMQLDLS